MTFTAFLGAIAVIGAASIAGRAILPPFENETPEERLAWGWGVGTLLLAGTEAALLLFGARPRPVAFVIVLAAAALAGTLRSRRGVLGTDALPYRGAVLALVAVAAAGVTFFLPQTIAEPLWSTDFLSMWGWKAKTIYFSTAVPGRLFHDPATYWSHPEYPFLLPLAMAGFSAVRGAWNDEILGLLWWAWQAAAVLGVAGYVRRRGSPAAGALAAAILAWFHPLYRAYNAGLADIPFAFAALLFAAACAERRPGRAALAAVLAAGTKQEGTLLALIGALVLLVLPGRDRAGSRRTAAAAAAAAALHFALLVVFRGPIGNRDFTGAPLIHPADLIARLSRLTSTLPARFSPALLVALAAIAVIVATTRRSREDVLLIVAALQIAAYFAAAVFSSYDPAWQLQGSFRTSAALAPLLAMALASRAAPALPK